MLMEKKVELTRSERLLSDALKINDADCRAILDSLVTVGVYVIAENTYQILYYNRRVKEVTPQIELGMACHELWKRDCTNCPIALMGEHSMARTIGYNDPFGDVVEITATRILWQGHIPAVLIRVFPHFDSTEAAVDAPKERAYPVAAKEVPYDFVTGSYTRLGLIKAMAKLRDNGTKLDKYAMLFIDILGFKSVNAVLGFAGGDSLLRATYTHVLSSELTPLFGARIEADHFVFIVERSALNLEKIPSLMEFKWSHGTQNIRILCRCGVYMITGDEETVDSMVDRAQMAKQQIADVYKLPYAVYEQSMQDSYMKRVDIIANFASDLQNSRFEVFYQPVVDAKTGKIASAEALVRWKRDGGYVPPGEFLPVLESCALITGLDEFVGRHAARYLRERYVQGLPIVPVSINLSQINFLDYDRIKSLIKELEHSLLPKGFLRFEITETAEKTDKRYLTRFIEQIHESGSRVYLDDFGSGFSSIEMIVDNTFDVLKIDMGIIRQLRESTKAVRITNSIIASCHAGGIEVVAEGVEDEDTAEILRSMGCDYIQGYYYSEPLNEADFSAYLKAHL